MGTEVTSASPAPDWLVISMASDATKSIRWLIAGGHVEPEQMTAALQELKDAIEREVDKL